MHHPHPKTNTHPKVLNLQKLPVIEQKSEEWYEMRRNMITASDFAQALGKGKFGSQKQLIEKKCLPRDNETAISKSNPFFKWGHTYEPVACEIYSKMHNDIKIHEFGLIQHPKHSFFGASPDGITDDGVMVEIKCPMKRKLTGEVPLQYYYQIQGQLDVCDLDECDYFECTFEEMPTFTEWSKRTDKFKGFFWENESGTIVYSSAIPPRSLSQSTGNVSIDQSIPDNIPVRYWILQEYNLKRVSRDITFVKDNIDKLQKVWEKILYYRDNRTAFEIDILNSICISTETMKTTTNNINHAYSVKNLIESTECLFRNI